MIMQWDGNKRPLLPLKTIRFTQWKLLDPYQRKNGNGKHQFTSPKCNNQPPNKRKNRRMVSDTESQYKEELSKEYKKQKFGNKMIWKGLIVQVFEDIQEDVYRQQKAPEFRSGTMWARMLVATTHKFFEEFWEMRNKLNFCPFIPSLTRLKVFSSSFFIFNTFSLPWYLWILEESHFKDFPVFPSSDSL